VEDRIVPTALELTRQLSGAWVEGAGRRSIGFSYQAIHERDHWCCAYCGRSVSKTPPCEALLATVGHVVPVSRGGPSSWLTLLPGALPWAHHPARCRGKRIHDP